MAKTAVRERAQVADLRTVADSPRTVQYNRANEELLEKAHDLTTRRGILEWLASVGMALTHDLPEMPRQKANTAAYVASVSLKSLG